MAYCACQPFEITRRWFSCQWNWFFLSLLLFDGFSLDQGEGGRLTCTDEEDVAEFYLGALVFEAS